MRSLLRASSSAGVLAALALAPSGCGDDGACTMQYVIQWVRVVDDAGQAVAGATVVATNLRTGEQLTAVTQTDGTTSAIGESIGGGTVRLVATLGARTSDPLESTWTCDACHCHPDPPDVTVVLPR